MGQLSTDASALSPEEELASRRHALKLLLVHPVNVCAFCSQGYVNLVIFRTTLLSSAMPFHGPPSVVVRKQKFPPCLAAENRATNVLVMIVSINQSPPPPSPPPFLILSLGDSARQLHLQQHPVQIKLLEGPPAPAAISGTLRAVAPAMALMQALSAQKSSALSASSRPIRDCRENFCSS